jgi:hypothetical protein
MRYALALLLFAGVAHADVTIQWEPPTTRVDGQPLAPEEISHYDVSCVVAGTEISPVAAPVYEIPASGETHEHAVTYPDLLPEYGEYSCALRTVDTDGLVSAWSNTVPLTWEPAAPGVPVNVLIITGASQ